MDTPKLDRHQIVAAALAIMQRGGIEALSMRKLAAELNIRAPTLYWYFPDRSAILHEAITTIFADTLEAVGDCMSWQAWLKSFGRQLWLTNKKLPFAIILLQSAELNDNDVFHLTISKLYDKVAPFQIEYSAFIEAYSHIQALIVGWAVFRQSGVMARLSEIINVEKAIEDGIDGIVALQEQRLAMGGLNVADRPRSAERW